jgi:Zn-dependent protease
MRMSWRIGRIAGIDLYLHPTFLLVLLFPGALAPGVPMLVVLALFGCVLLHELGHALMARHYGISTLDITLYPIGGVARLERMPRSPGAELLIALAGPAVNFAIVAALLGILVLGWPVLDSVPELESFLHSMTILNLGLGLFNLIPAFPMDGGRVLRALLSGWVGRIRATAVAASVGRFLALCFGIFSLLSGSLVHVALAAFIYLAAGAELAWVQLDERRRAAALLSSPAAEAPPGYQWVYRGQGVWQLAPVVVTTDPYAWGRSPWK